MNRTYNVELDDFADIFGIPIDQIPPRSRTIIQNNNFSYHKVSANEHTQIIKEIEQRISSNGFSVAGNKLKPLWEENWSDQLKKFIASGLVISGLTPEYFPKQTCRLNRDFVKPVDGNFEFNLSQAFKYWIFEYFGCVDSIYEFGCGTCMNIPILAELFPDKKLHGLDWVSASKNICTLLAQKYDWDLTGHVFDMSRPNRNFKVANNSGFLAFSALEQIGTNFKAFIDFAIQKRVAIFVTVDVIEELYDRKHPLDRLALRYIRKRNYLRKYLTYLKRLEASGKVEIINLQRVCCGSRYNDGYSYVIWRPTLTLT